MYSMTIYLMNFVRDVRWLHHWTPFCLICVYTPFLSFVYSFFVYHTKYTLFVWLFLLFAIIVFFSFLFSRSSAISAINFVILIYIANCVFTCAIFSSYMLSKLKTSNCYNKSYRVLLNEIFYILRILLNFSFSLTKLAYIEYVPTRTKISGMFAHRAL